MTTTLQQDIAAIVETFPIAGQDNNSQGFRDNFSNTKTALDKARTRIETLETNTAKLNVDNNFGGNAITNAEYNKLFGTVYPLSDLDKIVSTYTVNWTKGPLQVITLSGDSTIVFSGWPDSGNYASVRIHLKSDGASNWNVTGFSGGVIRKDANYPTTLTVPSTYTQSSHDIVALEAWTIDGGITVYVRYIGAFA